MSRSARALRLARRTPCQHCGRTTATVQGVCADCWGAKDPSSVRLGRRPRTAGLFMLDWDDPLELLAVASIALLFVASVVYVLSEWI